MQEKAKEVRKEMQGDAKKADEAVWRARIRRVAGELAWMGCAWLFGQATMLFETYPLGLSLLCAARRHTLSILIGLIASAFWQTEQPLIYICTYAAAALVREKEKKAALDSGDWTAMLARRRAEMKKKQEE